MIARKGLCPFAHYTECQALIQVLSKVQGESSNAPPLRWMALGTPYLGLERYLDLLTYFKTLLDEQPLLGLRVDVVTQRRPAELFDADEGIKIRLAEGDRTFELGSAEQVDDFIREIQGHVTEGSSGRIRFIGCEASGSSSELLPTGQYQAIMT